MENHHHCAECGDMIKPSDSVCVNCKSKLFAEHKRIFRIRGKPKGYSKQTVIASLNNQHEVTQKRIRRCFANDETGKK